jgi:hypothetical protein
VVGSLTATLTVAGAPEFMEWEPLLLQLDRMNPTIHTTATAQEIAYFDMAEPPVNWMGE